MSLALSVCVLFFLLLQLVNGAQFLNTTFLSLLVEFTAGGTGAIDIVPLTSMYKLLQSHKLDCNLVVLNLIWLLVSYIPR